MNAAIILEICAGSVASALVAQQGGAGRVELCDNLREGGTTPSYAAIAKARELLHIQLYPIIRPRGGDSLYDDLEFELMWKDIELCKQLGYDGVVIGLLTEDGKVDKKRTKLLTELAWPLAVTFHRAFDRSADPFAALGDIIETGCERILTSGQQPTVPEGSALIGKLVKEADDRIIIMPGSGITGDNIARLVGEIHAREYHATAKVVIKSKMKFKNNLVKNDEENELNRMVTDIDIIRKLRRNAEEAWQKLIA